MGGLSFTYGLETDDTVGSSYVFNAHDASWITFARGLFPAAQVMYRNRESAGCFNTNNFLAKVKAYQDTRPERVWVADTQRKYLRPYEDNGTVTYISMLAGRKTHQRGQVKTYNAYYYASKYVSDLCTSQNIMVRGNTPTSGTSITVVPPANTATLSMYINCYIVVASTSYNVVAKTKAVRGQTYVMDFSSIGSMGETELYFCTAPMITELSGLAHLYFKQNNFAMATNLQRLEIGSSVTGYENPNLENLTIGNNKMLEYLDVRNCPNATGALDLSGCVSLSEIYLENTAFTGITFATGGLLETAHLPSPTSLTMRELIYLSDLTLGSVANLSTIRIEDCEFDDSAELTIGSTTTSQETKDIVINLVESATNLTRVRLIGVDWSLSDTTDLELIYRMYGIDDEGYDSPQSVVTGHVYIPTMRQSQLTRYGEVWQYLDITYDSMVTQYLVTFLNADGDPILDRNGNAYTQWVDAGSAPYDPITMGYEISISDSGSPTANEYSPTTYDGDYYLDVTNGYIYLADNNSWSVVAVADILTPTMPSTAQYTYFFVGWDDITTIVSYARNVTAEYTTVTRTYTVKFYRDASTLLRTITDVPYGACIDYASSDDIVGYGAGSPVECGYTASSYSGKYYQNMVDGTIYYSNGTVWSASEFQDSFVMPTWTTDENSYIFRLFNGWDKNTGNITGDINVYAKWKATSGSLPAANTDMSDMTTPQIYGICRAGLQDAYFSALDHIDITMGHDYNFSNVESVTIGEKYDPTSSEEVLTLSGITVDQFVSGGYYFNGSTQYLTDISLLAVDSPAFTMAIDFDFIGTTSGSTLVSANYGSTANFRLYYNGSYATIQWGDTSVNVGYAKCREMVVLRHPKGSKTLYVYSAGYTGASADRFSPNITRTTLTRTTNITDEVLTLGAVNFHTTSNTFRNPATGHIHWMKIWYDDIGNANAYNLASWSHERMRMEYWGKNKYEYADGSGNLTGASFIPNCPFAQKGYYMNSSNTNEDGWDGSLMRTFLNTRVYKAMPTDWQAMIKRVQINTTEGLQSQVIVTSNDKIYLQSYRELGGSGTGYNDEIGADSASPNIPWFVAQTASTTVSSANTANAQRIKWRGRIRQYALGDGASLAYDGITPYIFSSGTEPSAAYSTNITPGSIWINTNNSSIGYMFVSQTEINQYGLTVYASANSNYASGGWVAPSYWWERSPNLSYSTGFMTVYTTGSLYNSSASSVVAVAPSFSI